VGILGGGATIDPPFKKNASFFTGKTERKKRVDATSDGLNKWFCEIRTKRSVELCRDKNLHPLPPQKP